MAIIGISGKIGSGKDTIGAIIQYLDSQNKGYKGNYDDWRLTSDRGLYPTDWRIKKFAYKLKQIVSLLTGIPIEDLEKEEVKNSYLGPEWVRYSSSKEVGEKMTVRQLLQEVGTDAMRNVIHTNVWVNALFSEYKLKIGKYDSIPIRDSYPNWIITDVRFPNEAAAILSKNQGYIIRVERGKINPCSAHGQHISETALDNYPHFSAKIENNGSIEELTHKVEKVLHNFNLLKQTQNGNFK